MRHRARPTSCLSDYVYAFLVNARLSEQGDGYDNHQLDTFNQGECMSRQSAR